MAARRQIGRQYPSEWPRILRGDNTFDSAAADLVTVAANPLLFRRWRSILHLTPRNINDEVASWDGSRGCLLWSDTICRPLCLCHPRWSFISDPCFRVSLSFKAGNVLNLSLGTMHYDPPLKPALVRTTRNRL